MIKKILSCGRPGAEHGAVLAAKSLKLNVGGNLGSRDELLKFNIKDSDGTVIFDPERRRDFDDIVRTCTRIRKPFLYIDTDLTIDKVNVFERFIYKHNIKVLNVVGDTEIKSPGIEHSVYTIIKCAMQ